MPIYESTKELETRIDENGNEQTTIIEKIKKRERSSEPDYIKLYTRVWCEFNQIPDRARPLFLELVCHMSYANTNEKDGGQLVATGGPVQESICKKLNITRSTYQRYLRDLCECNAIRSISRGYYQISPNYAGRGEWKYNPRLNRGGVEELVATFKLNVNGEKSCNTTIVWADNGESTEMNKIYRKMTDSKPGDQTVMSVRSIDILCDEEEEEQEDVPF